MTQPFEHKKSLGQNFLTSDVVPRWMCDAAGDISGETVVEIGPGTGALTREILARGASVIALEADERAIAILRETFADAIKQGQLTLHHTDVRNFTTADLNLPTHSFHVIANIPYYLSGFLFRTFLDTEIQPKNLVFLVQKEVAKRITSDMKRGEKESLLSLSVKVFGDPVYIKTVSRGHFMPPPRVDSAIIAVRNIHTLPSADFDTAFFFTLLHAGFGQKRKQLQKNLQELLPKATIGDIFLQLTIPDAIRAEDLTKEQWLALAVAVRPHIAPTL